MARAPVFASSEGGRARSGRASLVGRRRAVVDRAHVRRGDRLPLMRSVRSRVASPHRRTKRRRLPMLFRAFCKKSRIAKGLASPWLNVSKTCAIGRTTQASPVLVRCSARRRADGSSSCVERTTISDLAAAATGSGSGDGGAEDSSPIGVRSARRVRTLSAPSSRRPGCGFMGAVTVTASIQTTPRSSLTSCAGRGGNSSVQS
jgi:hypothetical protein